MFKVTINDLRMDISILKKSTKANTSKQNKDKEEGSSKKSKGKKGKAPLEDSNAEAQKSCDDACEFPSIPLMIANRTLQKVVTMNQTLR